MANRSLMGWNQIVKIDDVEVKASDFNVGNNQDFTVPDMVTGSSDRLTWYRGVITTQGNFTAPLTDSLNTSLITYATQLAPNPSTVFTLFSSLHGTVNQCKVNTMTISANAGEPINVTSEIWGIAQDQESTGSTGVSDPGAAVTTGTGGVIDGVDISGSQLHLEEVFMWDTVTGAENFLPDGTRSTGEVVGIELTINNNLIRNWTLTAGGDLPETYTGRGNLNAFSISAGQRAITGTITYISDKDGLMWLIKSAGLTNPSTPTVTFGPITFNFANANVVLGAVPPTLNTGIVQIQVPFQIVADATGGAFVIGV